MNEEGEYVRVRVSADAKKESVERMRGGLRISVREPAEENRANARVRELVASEYGVPLARVRLISGRHAPSKKFFVMKKEG
ncbi:MAG TPA: DUF167 domain-containing protein [Candidatus Paceibacterota bacterium]